MANTRQQIVDALKTRMATITTGNGYSATIKTVDEWVMRPLEDDSLPAIVVRDTTDSLPQDGVGSGRRDHELQVFLVVEFSSSSSLSQCRELLADMLAAIGTDATFGGLAYDCDVLSTELVSEEANKKASFGQMILTIRYRSAAWSM